MAQINLSAAFCFALFSFLFIYQSKAKTARSLFIFGDSLADVGNNNYLPFSVLKANFAHNGIDFPTKNPTGRFSNGKNTADFIAERMGLASPPAYRSLDLTNQNDSSYLKGVNFASGGAGIMDELIQEIGQSITLREQVDDFGLVYEEMVHRMGFHGARRHVSKSVFLFMIGANDMIHYNLEPNLRINYSSEQLVDSMATTLKLQIQRLYNKGSRKFLVAGIPQMGCTPSARSGNETQGCYEEMNNWSAKCNKRFKSMLKGLESELIGFSFSFNDIYAAMQHIIQNPTRYGFREVKEACCGLGSLNAEIHCIPISNYCSNRSDYLFWDKYHPTEKACKYLARAFFDQPII